MKILCMWLLFICSFTKLGSAEELPATNIQGKYVVEKTYFGVLRPNDPMFLSTRNVPYVIGQTYGWIVLLRTNERKIRWVEQFSLPDSPRTWGKPDPVENRSCTDDEKTCYSEREVEVEDGIISNFWSIAPGDPKGRHTIRVYVEGSIATEIDFYIE